MKLTSSSIFLSMMLAASAFPVRRQNMEAVGEKKEMNAPSGQVMGAAYFITNEPNGNVVISADIGADGQLTLREGISTGGFGAHGDDGGANGPDPLFTQGAVKASAAGNILATVNAGSNTVSLFGIDPTNPASLTPIGVPVGSGGEFPVSLAINQAGDSVCVLNGGEVNGVSCFSVDQQAGLVPKSGTNRALNLNQTTPANGPPGTASHVIFSEDGTKLIASVKGVPPQPGFLAVWDISQDGSLSEEFQQIAPAEGGLLPFSMTLIPGKNAILATDAGIGFDIFDMNEEGRNSAVAVDGQMATCWSSFSPKTGNFYLTDIGTSLVTEVNVDDNLVGTIVQQYDQGAGSATIDNDIATIEDNDFMYVLLPNATSVSVLSLNAPGAAQNIQQLDIAGPASAVGLPISSANLQGMTTFVAAA